MQAKADAKAAETASLLESFGFELSAGGLVVMTDFAKAERAYIHHTSGPVAVVAMAVASPTFAPRSISDVAPCQRGDEGASDGSSGDARASNGMWGQRR